MLIVKYRWFYLVKFCVVIFNRRGGSFFMVVVIESFNGFFEIVMKFLEIDIRD